MIDAFPAALPCSPDLLREALPGGGAAISLLRDCAANPAPLKYVPLEGERFGSFMANVLDDATLLASRTGPGVSVAHAAEAMRLAVIDGQLGADVYPGDKARMLYALYGVRQAAEALERLSPMLAATTSFQSLPPEQAWRMLLDQAHWDDGRHAGLRFENEPGYMGAMYNGLSLVLEAHQNGRAFDASMLEEVHDVATQGVYDRDLPLKERGVSSFVSASKRTRPVGAAAVPRHAQDRPVYVCDFEPGFKGNVDGLQAQFDLDVGINVTRAGLKDFFANQARHPKKQQCTMDIWNERGTRTRLQSPSGWDGEGSLLVRAPYLSQGQNKDKARSIIADYRRKLPRAATEDAKLAEIARCVQRLEQAHLFMDGNARTTGFLVLNKLLLETGLNPAMIADPNRFDAYSVNELVQEIRQGQKTFAEHCVA